MKIRLLPPINPALQTTSVQGRIYSGTPGSVVDIEHRQPGGARDADELMIRGWTKIAPCGPTAERPSGSFGDFPALEGRFFYDTTIDALIVFDGDTWRNPATGAAV
jgi:hypothetical protein